MYIIFFYSFITIDSKAFIFLEEAVSILGFTKHYTDFGYMELERSN